MALGRVFMKTGQYIFNLGVVNFMEYLIINLFLVIYAYKDESQKLVLIEKSSTGGNTLPFLDQNEYTILMFAYNLGSFLSLSSLQSVTL